MPDEERRSRPSEGQPTIAERAAVLLVRTLLQHRKWQAGTTRETGSVN
jgi:hypothetical protein